MTHLYLRVEDTLYPNLASNQEFMNELWSLFSKFYTTVEFMYVSEQLKAIDAYMQTKPDYKTLSLDPLFIGDCNIEISRCYENNADGAYVRHIVRPESKYKDVNTMYAEQLLSLQYGDKIVIVEDDCVTGKSLHSITTLVRKRTYRDPEVLVLKDIRKIGNTEVLDLRDFIPNAPYGGLVVCDWIHSPSYKGPYRTCYLNLFNKHLMQRMSLESEEQTQYFKELMNELLLKYETISLLPF